MDKQQENRAFAKMIKEFPKAFGRVSFRERLMLRTTFSYVIEEVIGDIKANFDCVLEGKALEIKTLGERCNQLLKDKGDLIEQIEKMKCCYNCFYDCEDCNSKNKDCDKCPCGTCVKHNHWELRR